MGARGFAIIDVETTGFSPRHGDRVLEIGGMGIRPDGGVDALIETLVDPQRDVGPTHVHGITARDLVGAPVFGEIAPALLEFLDGRVLVGHNLSFDLRFLTAEFDRAGVRTPEPVVIDTMTLARQFLADGPQSFRLGDVCEHLGLDVEALMARLGLEPRPLHSAFGDAVRTAGLLSAFIDASPTAGFWEQLLDAAAAVRWPERDAAAPLRARRRGDADASPGSHSIAEVLTAVEAVLPGPKPTSAYAAELEDVLVDRRLDADEVDRLIEIATRLGLDAATLGSLHRGAFDRVVHAAWADGILTPEELLDIHLVADLLGIDHDSVLAAQLGGLRTAGGDAAVPFGSEIVLTGDPGVPRGVLAERLTSAGFQVAASVTKRTRLVIAADPHSRSGKAQKARAYGIPVVGLDDAQRLLGVELRA